MLYCCFTIANTDSIVRGQDVIIGNGHGNSDKCVVAEVGLQIITRSVLRELLEAYRTAAIFFVDQRRDHIAIQYLHRPSSSDQLILMANAFALNSLTKWVFFQMC